MGEMVEIVAITLIGGIGTFFGPILGAFVLVVGLEALRGLADYRLMIYGAVMVIRDYFNAQRPFGRVQPFTGKGA